MKEIKANSIGEAWINSCKHILENGKLINDGDREVKEAMHLLVEIENPSQEDIIIKKHGNKEMVDWMLSNFLEEKRVPELKNTLSYGTRLFNFKGKNQINWIVERLKKKPETKAATINMIMHDDEEYIPCVSTIDFKIRGGKLLVSAMCRAIDFGKKVYGNMLALYKIQKMVAEKLDIETGALIMYNISAHIYEDDYEEIKKILGEEIRK